MDENHLNNSDKTILHIFPSPNKHNDADKAQHPVHNLGKHDKHRFKLKFNTGKTVNSTKKRPIGIPRKYPHVTREHTDFDKYPYKMTCPNCLSYIKTNTYHYSTQNTHAVAASLSPICMCMIPYFTIKYKNTAHYCPRCEIYLGTKFVTRKDIFFLRIKPKKHKSDV